MEEDKTIGQKVDDPSALQAKEGEESKVESDDKSADLESRFKGLQGSLQKEVEEKKRLATEKEELERKVKEYEFEKLSEMEKLQHKMKELEEEKNNLAKQAEQSAVAAKWSEEWNKIKEEFPNAAKLAIIREKAEKNPGALGNPDTADFESWVESVREELKMTEESLSGTMSQDIDRKKLDNQNSSADSKADLYKGLSPEEKLERMRKDLGVESSW